VRRRWSFFFANWLNLGPGPVFFSRRPGSAGLQVRTVESDEALIRRIRGGDIAAFDVLYDKHETRLFAYLRAMLGVRADAEEVLHDAFLAVLKDQSAVFDREGSFRAWLYRVARNHALNRRRATGRRDRTLAEAFPSSWQGQGQGQGHVSAPPRADDALEAAELENALSAAVGKLPAALGELWHLRTSGLSYEQMASVVDAPLGTIKSRMHQMVSVLREELKPWIAP
jgi:RNA polymerase sigma-70 factor (ECF subfamily)